MAASGTFTVTGKTGAGQTLTAGVYTGVSSFLVDIAAGMLFLTFNGVTQPIAISAATTVTATIVAAGGNWTVTIS